MLTLGLLGLLLAGAARGELASVDLDAPGDGLLARDTDAGLDWLDVTATAGFSRADLDRIRQVQRLIDDEYDSKRRAQ